MERLDLRYGVTLVAGFLACVGICGLGLADEDPAAGNSDLSAILTEARACADAIPKDISQAHVLRRIGAMQARMGDV